MRMSSVHRHDEKIMQHENILFAILWQEHNSREIRCAEVTETNSIIYSFRLSSQVLKQLLVFHGRRLSFGLDKLLQRLGDLLLALAGSGTHTCDQMKNVRYAPSMQ